ncbi:M43 family zinc metalloprotease [Pontimicrobium sp. IMCC45349]|uniref:M43 family zinc metalloprotease n=1 Tax=Pontimicrobium sp. IMCC45349 TaxID=3391574 RepID=UPI00399FE495
MKNFTQKFLFLFVLVSFTALNAQTKGTLIDNAQTTPDGHVRCATDEYNAALLENSPRMMGSDYYENWIAPKVAAVKAQRAANPDGSVLYTIPVVVHVIHNGEPIGTGANISDAQVISQITVMNEDFRRMAGTNGFNTDPDGADVEIEFCLAQRTPDGCVTNGIDRIDMSAVSTSWSGPGGNTDTVLKPATYWDASQYMNMWSVNFSDGSLLGYAQFPGGPAESDGVVSNYTFFGSNDAAGVTLPAPFNLGRTMTHEVGHYLGLYHTFQGGCASDDFCADTPPIAGPNYGCPTGTDSCPGGDIDMVENYMDYSDDACMNVFTNDQKARILATMGSAANRPSTATSNACTPLADVSDDGSIEIEELATIPCSPDIDATVRITNWGTVALMSATITYDVDGGASTDYMWSGNLAYGEFTTVTLPTFSASGGSHTLNVSINNPNGNPDARSCNDTANESFNGSDSFATTTQVHLALTLDQYGSETTWEFRDSSNALLYSGGPYTDGTEGTVINDSFNVVPDECYAFIINDGYGDGICCDWGNGSYELRADDNTLIASGGQFSDTETQNVSTFALGINDYFANSGIGVYPNPATNVLNIKLANTGDLPDSYQVYNMIGQLVTQNEISAISDLTIDTSAYSNGMYFVKITKDNNSVSLPFVKK